MHHDFAWCLDLLQTIQRYVIEIRRAIQVSLLISHHLLKQVVSSCFSLLLLQQQVVG